jgi:hypothetical protein
MTYASSVSVRNQTNESLVVTIGLEKYGDRDFLCLADGRGNDIPIPVDALAKVIHAMEFVLGFEPLPAEGKKRQAPEAPCSSDEELDDLFEGTYGYESALRAVYDLGREHGSQGNA